MSICHLPSPSPVGTKREKTLLLGGCLVVAALWGILEKLVHLLATELGKMGYKCRAPAGSQAGKLWRHTPFHSGGLGCVDTKAEGETELGHVDNIVPILGCIASTLLLHIVWSLCCQEGSWGPSVHLHLPLRIILCI